MGETLAQCGAAALTLREIAGTSVLGGGGGHLLLGLLVMLLLRPWPAVIAHRLFLLVHLPFCS